jgi:hypothetical protein
MECLEGGQYGNQCHFAAAVRARLCMGLVVHVRMDNRDAVDDVAMVKETNIRVV